MAIDKIEESQRFSEEILQKIQNDLSEQIDNKNICIITTGSYARGEASPESDMDYFVVVKNGNHDIGFEEKDTIKSTIDKYIKKDAGDSGTFGDDAIEVLEDMLKNIGGNDDTNIKTTRRMLLLLESKALYNKYFYDDIVKRLLTIYIKPNITEHQIARFLLNDMIRYYRTITIDFEYKVSEVGKSWGLRNIKLTYSRKLIYFAGILMVAQTADKSREDKIKTITELLNITPLERISNIIDNENKVNIYNLYNNFLTIISNEEKRDSLNKIYTINDEKNKLYYELKKESKKFSNLLINAIDNTFEVEHRIHDAILF